MILKANSDYIILVINNYHISLFNLIINYSIFIIYYSVYNFSNYIIIIPNEKILVFIKFKLVINYDSLIMYTNSGDI